MQVNFWNRSQVGGGECPHVQCRVCAACPRSGMLLLHVYDRPLVPFSYHSRTTPVPLPCHSRTTLVPLSYRILDSYIIPATPQRRPSDAPATPQRRPNDAPATPQRRLDDSPATPHDRFRSVTWSSPLFSKSSLSFALYHSLMTCIFDDSSTDSKRQGAESNTVDSWRVPQIEIESKLKSTGPHRRSLANPRVRTCAPLRS